MLFSKGKMRKRWVEGKDAAKDACVNKGEENYLKLFSKDDFGPTLDNARMSGVCFCGHCFNRPVCVPGDMQNLEPMPPHR